MTKHEPLWLLGWTCRAQPGSAALWWYEAAVMCEVSVCLTGHFQPLADCCCRLKESGVVRNKEVQESKNATSWLGGFGELCRRGGCVRNSGLKWWMADLNIPQPNKNGERIETVGETDLLALISIDSSEGNPYAATVQCLSRWLNLREQSLQLIHIHTHTHTVFTMYCFSFKDFHSTIHTFPFKPVGNVNPWLSGEQWSKATRLKDKAHLSIRHY